MKRLWNWACSRAERGLFVGMVLGITVGELTKAVLS